jgi:Mce-associated membrane protein
VTEPILDEEGVPTRPEESSTGISTSTGVVEIGDGRRRRPFLAVAVVACVAAIGFGLLAAVLGSRLNGERRDRQEVEDTSGRFAAALLTYDYNDLAAAKKRVLALSTGNFRKQYEEAFTGGLDTLFQSTKATSAGTTKDVFVGDIANGTVTSIAVVDAVAQGTTGSRRLISSYIQLDLVKVHGKWLVDGVTNLNLGAAADASPLPTPTTSTTAPPK